MSFPHGLAGYKTHGCRCDVCKRATAEYSRAWRGRNPKKVRGYNLRTLYGISVDEYDAMYASQDGRCAICLVPLAVLHVDHDHDTGVVRGLLCNSRNLAIGQLGHDVSRLTSATDYLIKIA